MKILLVFAFGMVAGIIANNAYAFYFMMQFITELSQ